MISLSLFIAFAGVVFSLPVLVPCAVFLSLFVLSLSDSLDDEP